MAFKDFRFEDECHIREFVDVHEKMTKFIVEQLDRCEAQERIVNWPDFFDYMKEFWRLPDITILKAMASAVLKTKYKLAGDFDKFIELRCQEQITKEGQTKSEES